MFWKVVLSTIAITFPANAQEGHKRWHHYYQHWKQKGTNVGCCTARTYSDQGLPLNGDCQPAVATIRDGRWFAMLPDVFRERYGNSRGEIEVPDNMIIRERNPVPEEGHLCWTPQSGVLCFVPPDTSG